MTYLNSRDILSLKQVQKDLGLVLRLDYVSDFCQGCGMPKLKSFLAQNFNKTLWDKKIQDWFLYSFLCQHSQTYTQDY